jgi:hypothetical protein
MCRSMSAASRTSSAKLRKARVMGVRGSRDEAISPTVCEPMGSASGTAAAPYLPSRPPGEMFPRASSPLPHCPVAIPHDDRGSTVSDTY